jgi:hypothetical protein
VVSPPKRTTISRSKLSFLPGLQRLVPQGRGSWVGWRRSRHTRMARSPAAVSLSGALF